jgi:hypothetical protein
MFSAIHPAPRRSSLPGLCSTSHAHPPPHCPTSLFNLSSIPSAPAVFPTRQFPRDHTDDTSSSCALYPNRSFSPPPPIILSESHTIIRALALASLCLPRSSCTTTLCVFRRSFQRDNFHETTQTTHPRVLFTPATAARRSPHLHPSFFLNHTPLSALSLWLPSAFHAPLAPPHCACSAALRTKYPSMCSLQILPPCLSVLAESLQDAS